MRRAHDGTPGVRDEGRGGFTLIELMLVVVIIGILAQIAIPNMQAVRTKARAVDVMANIRVIENAAENYIGDEHTFPDDASTGQMPPGLGEYMPDGFSWSREDYELDWENISVPGGLPGDPSTSRIVGVAVVTDNDELASALTDLFGENNWFVYGNSYVRILERL